MYSADVVITPTTQLKYSRKETRPVSGNTNVFGRLQTELPAHCTCLHLHVHSCTCTVAVHFVHVPVAVLWTRSSPCPVLTLVEGTVMSARTDNGECRVTTGGTFHSFYAGDI